MPKIKSHKGTAKRFRKSGAGRWLRPKAWRGHHLEIKSSRRTRRYAGVTAVSPAHQKQLKRLLPYE
ncbi:MAG: 50S ribosomal protein L35 [Chloroflexota bacterium]|nr:50S ribosomal protein L35 [Chloroflexota bacterium]